MVANESETQCEYGVVDDDELHPRLAAQVRAMPEFRMGVHRVGVTLLCGVRVEDVLVSEGRVTGVIGRDRLPFYAGEVAEVTDQSDRPLPP
jgi:ribulose 1,5-bisphosphate synthetase/thiazole synthase